jgi:hypothetical protein
MFTLFGLIPLLCWLYIRPQEVFPVLQTLPVLNLATGLGALGLLIDLRLGRAYVSPAPALRYLVLLVLWAFLVTSIRRGGDASSILMGRLFIPTAVLLLLAHGVTSFRSLQVMTAVVLCLGLFITFACLHQARQPLQCFVQRGNDHASAGTPDGRPCERPRDCYVGDIEPGAEYQCERAGIFGTSTVGGRVRYRGILQDPNEAALAIGITLPFVFAFVQRSRRAWAVIFIPLLIGAVGLSTIYSQSRSGQLVFLTVLGAYFVRRFGLGAGVAVAALFAGPVLLLGGRSGAEAEASAAERIETLYTGVEFVRQSPLLGLGVSQFAEHHYLTAHNAYLLIAAELGFPGLFLWGAVVYLSIKTQVLAIRRYAQRPEAHAAQTWAMAILASFCGLLIGIFFLSFSYHNVLFIYLGLAGALHSACRRHDPDFSVRLSLREGVLLAVGGVVLIAFIGLYARMKIA